MKLLRSKSKSMCQIVDNTPVLLSKIQTQTVWNLHKFAKLLQSKSKSLFQIVEDVPVSFVKDSDANSLESPQVC